MRRIAAAVERRIKVSRFNLKNNYGRFARIAVAGVLLVGSALASTEAKKHRKSVPSDMQVVGHSALDGLRGVKMFVRENEGKYYLYAANQSSQGFAIVDVTEPREPKLIKNYQATAGVPGTLEQIGDLTFATIESKLEEGAQNNLRATRFTVWDLADPANPKVFKSFSDVSGVFVDDRKLIYVMDGEGLWILKKAQPKSEFPYGPNDPYPNGQCLYCG
jgi:hypothetical protein